MPIFDRKNDINYVRWAQEVKKRDGFTCQVCYRGRIALNSHHLNGWASYPDQRYDVENGATLCVQCHEAFHELYGKGANTEDQFEEFRQITQSLIKSASINFEAEKQAKKIKKAVENQHVIQEILKKLESDYNK